MRLTFEEIELSDAGAADAEQLAAWWNDGAVMAHAGFPLGLGITKEQVAQSLTKDSDEKGRRLMLRFQGAPIGEMNYRNLGGGTAEIGIKICETAYQEKGVGRKALSMLIGELFRRGFAKIILDTNLMNARAQHVYEKLGFRKTGVRPDAWTDQMGVKQSAVDYELTKADFHDFASPVPKESTDA